MVTLLQWLPKKLNCRKAAGCVALHPSEFYHATGVTAFLGICDALILSFLVCHSFNSYALIIFL
jgi:hypothetical protein